MATRIKKLKWQEISEVDAAANEAKGWIIQKAAKEAGDFETAIVELQKALASDSAELFFENADEKVRKAVDRVLKHLDENLEETDDDDETDDSDEDEPVEKEKRGLAKLKEIFSLAKAEEDETTEDNEAEETDESVEEDESTEEDKTDETSDDDGVEKDKKKAPKEEDDEEDEEDGGDDEDEEDASGKKKVKKNKLEKSAVSEIVNAVKEELDPIREAVGALADRTENLEKHAAGRTSLMGQDGSEDEDEDDERAGLHKAITGAIRTGEKITLT